MPVRHLDPKILNYQTTKLLRFTPTTLLDVGGRNNYSYKSIIFVLFFVTSVYRVLPPAREVRVTPSCLLRPDRNLLSLEKLDPVCPTKRTVLS